MKQFSSLYQAAEYAVTLCSSWSFATSDEKYDKGSLLGIAEIHEAENPTDEDSYYVVSSYGSIGYCPDGEDIDWLFLADSVAGEYLPLTFVVTSEIKFCPQCGAEVVPGGCSCPQCGEQL